MKMTIENEKLRVLINVNYESLFACHFKKRINEQLLNVSAISKIRKVKMPYLL